MIRPLMPLAVLLVAGAVHAQARTTAAARATAPPRIDGRLDEPVWRSATPLTGFVQREPVEGTPVSERTEVRILSDDRALYVGAWLYDSDPHAIVPGEKIRDVTLGNSDYFGFILDTYLDRQNGFLFATTPAGIEHDGHVTREGEGGGVFQSNLTRVQTGALGGLNLNWDGAWSVATSRDSAGWYAEFRIPFSTIRYGPAGTQTWGLNVMRGIRRRNEEALWSPVARQFNIMRLSQAGRLESLAVPPQRIATVTPYVLGSTSRQFALEDRYRTPTEWGVDAKYGLTPSLTLDLSYNTDFAQVEVDEQRTNLTRFPLFYPEKRPFFLENAGAFAAGSPQGVELFFSRRIGLDSLGQATPILGGGRITGRVAGMTVGALEMVTDAVGAVNGNSYSVLRVTRETGKRSRIGAIGVQRTRVGDQGDFNRVLGADGRIGLGQAWTVDWWGANSVTPGRTSDDFAYSGRVAYQTRRWSHSARTVRAGADFNPEVGFMARPAGFQFYELAAMRLIRNFRWRQLRQWNPHTVFTGFYDMHGNRENTQLHVDLTEFEFQNGGRYGPEINLFRDRPAQPFRLANGVVLPPREYAWVSVGLDASTNASAVLSTSVQGTVGQFYDGTRQGAAGSVTARRASSASLSLLFDYQDVRVSTGAFVRKLYGIKGSWFFTPHVFVQTLSQYSNQARSVTANVRFAWLRSAGTGLFIVLNDGEQAGGITRWETPITRSFTVKYALQID